MKPLAETVLEEIESFLAAHEMTPTTFGLRTVNDGHFVADLRRLPRRNVTANQIDRIRQFMRDYRPEKPRRRCNRSCAA